MSIKISHKLSVPEGLRRPVPSLVKVKINIRQVCFASWPQLANPSS